MFSLVITLISIALVALLAISAIFYGGPALNKSAAIAQAAESINQGNQVLAAMDLYRVDHGQYPSSIEDLVAENYLKQIPSLKLSQVKLTALAQASNQGSWTIPVSQLPVAWTPVTGGSSFDIEVCKAVNLKARNYSGILKRMQSAPEPQCFGSSNTNLKIVVSRSALALEQSVNSDPLQWNPSAEVPSTSDPEWLIAPPTASTGGSGGTPPAGDSSDQSLVNYTSRLDLREHRAQYLGGFYSFNTLIGSTSAGSTISKRLFIRNLNVTDSIIFSASSSNPYFTLSSPAKYAIGYSSAISAAIPQESSCSGLVQSGSILNCATSPGNTGSNNGAFSIRFSPPAGTLPGVYTSTISINHNISNVASPIQIEVSAQVANQAPPSLGVAPASSFNFGSVLLTQSSTRTFTVSNGGQLPIEDLSIYLSNPDSAFSISGTTCTTFLQGGSSCSISVNFAPSQEVPFDTVLEVYSQTHDLSSNVTLAGSGTSNALISSINFDQGDFIDSVDSSLGLYGSKTSGVSLSSGASASIISNCREGTSCVRFSSPDTGNGAIRYSPKPELSFGNSNFEIEFWFRRTQSNGIYTTGLLGFTGGSKGLAYFSLNDAARPMLVYLNGSGGTVNHTSSGVTIALNTWYKATISRENGQMYLRINDILRLTVSDTTVYDENLALLLGNTTISIPRGFKGDLDSITIRRF